jgi:protein SCO1
VIRRAALIAGLIVGCLPCAAHHHSRQALKRTRAGWPVMPFTLTDQHGRPFTQDRLTGRWTFMLFGDAASRDRCDAALAALVGLHRRIARTQVLETTQVLLVWLEALPQRDRLRDQLAAFDPRFIGTTGTAQTLHALLDDLRSDDGTEADTPRAGTLLLVGPDASRRAEYLPPFDVPWLTAAFLKARVGR